jgi:hypothetical protein
VPLPRVGVGEEDRLRAVRHVLVVPGSSTHVPMNTIAHAISITQAPIRSRVTGAARLRRHSRCAAPRATNAPVNPSRNGPPITKPCTARPDLTVRQLQSVPGFLPSTPRSCQHALLKVRPPSTIDCESFGAAILSGDATPLALAGGAPPSLRRPLPQRPSPN